MGKGMGLMSMVEAVRSLAPRKPAGEIPPSHRLCDGT